MAKKEEEQRDKLFDLSLGDGLIEVNEASITEKSVIEKTDTEEDNAETTKVADAEKFAQYEDGTFEIDDIPSETTKEVSIDTKEFIEKTENEETGKTKTPSKDGSSDSSSSSPFLAFARDRANEGVFLEFNDKDWEELVERNENDEAAALRELSSISIKHMVKEGVESFKESLTPEEKNLYEAKEKGLPVDEYSTAKRDYDKYSKLSGDDIKDNIELQEEVVIKVLELRGYSPEEVKEEVEGYKALENLESKAEKAIVVLPDFYKNKVNDIETGAKVAEDSRQDQLRQRVAKMKRSIDNTPEIIPGIKLNKLTREKVMKSMTVPVAKDAEGNPMNPVMTTRNKNPDAFEMMIHYYHELGLFNIDDDGQMKPDFSKIAKIEKTKAADSMREIFETKEKTITGKARIPEESKDELDEFDKAFGRL